MLSGIILITATGLMFMLVGVVYSTVSEKNINFPAFMFFYAVIFFAMIHVFQMPPRATALELMPMAASLIPASFLGHVGFLTLYWGMQKTPHAVAWTFAQSAMVVPFLGGWLLLGNKINCLNLTGMVVLMMALFLLGKSKNTPTEITPKSNNGIFLCIMSLLFTGISQFLTLLSGEFYPADSELLAWRLPLIAWPGIFFWGALWLFKKRKAGRLIGLWALIYAGIVFAGQNLLYMSVDKMQNCNLVGIVYPAAISICIVTFALFCRFCRNEKLNKLGFIGLVMMLSSVILLFI